MEDVINTPKKLISALVDLYFSARKMRFSSGNVLRGRSHSVSSEFEDLFAHYLSNCMGSEYSFYVDQPISIQGSGLNTQYPDILILKNGKVSHLIDLKLDNGWNRGGLGDFTEKKNIFLKEIKGKRLTYKEVILNKKTSRDAHFSTEITYHVVFATCVNGTKNLSDTYSSMEKENVKIYVLTEGVHPNAYGLDETGILGRIKIRESEFSRLLANIVE